MTVQAASSANSTSDLKNNSTRASTSYLNRKVSAPLPSNMDLSFLDASIPELVKQLTIDEKVSLLAGKNWWETVEIPRLNIPSLKVTDGPNGARGGSFYKMIAASALPNATCVGAAFDADLTAEAGRLLAAEAKARGASCLLAPTVNIQRSPLGGRAFESFSEDPTLSGLTAAAYINGLQENGVSATIKHFVANDQEHERNGSDSIVAPRPLREVYLRPFQIAQRLAKPGAYMTSYNKLNGTHCSENKWLLGDLLRKEWAFDGLVMSDWYGTYSTDLGINAGLDLEMPGGADTWRNQRYVSRLISAHKIDPRTIDERATKVLTWVQKWARLSPEEVYGDHSERTRTEDRDNDAALLRRLASEGIVLLKNDNEVLPVKQGKVCVIGPNAKARVITGGGSAELRAAWSVNPWEGLVNNAPEGVELSYKLGCETAKFLPVLDEHFTTLDGKAGYDINFYAVDAETGKVAEAPTVKDWGDRSQIFLADFHHPDLGGDYVTELLATFTAPINGGYEFGITGTGQSWLYIDNEVVIDNSKNQTMGTQFFGNGTVEVKKVVQVKKGNTYAIRVVHDTRRPSDRTTQAGPFTITGIRIGAAEAYDEDQAILDAVAAAKSADRVVLVAGLNPDWETEGYDRSTLSLPLRCDDLITAVAEANPNTVVVLQCGSAVSMPWVNKVAGIVQAWYGGNEAGNAIADVIYGRQVPAGRLPVSFPKSERDIAASQNFKSARTRVHYEEGIWVGYKHHNARGIEPLFPFGHGLSYTSFKYDDLKVEAPQGSTAADWSLKASINVTNTGSVTADHSVHFYTAPPPETATGLKHPEVALQAFKKVYNLQPGQTQRVEVDLDKYAISHWDEGYDTWTTEIGTWAVKVGVDAQTMVASGDFEVKENMEWRGL